MDAPAPAYAVCTDDEVLSYHEDLDEARASNDAFAGQSRVIRLADGVWITPKKRGVRAREVRATTINVKRMSKRALALAAEATPHDPTVQRPRTRGECENAERPCPWVSCRYHLYLDVMPATGSIKLNYPDLEVDQLTESCALDVADREGATLDEVGKLMNVTRERIRQVENVALKRIEKLDRRIKILVQYANPDDPTKRTTNGHRSPEERATMRARAVKRYVEGVALAEIGVELGCSADYVANLVSEARRRGADIPIRNKGYAQAAADDDVDLAADDAEVA